MKSVQYVIILLVSSSYADLGGDHPKALTRAAETDCQYICYPHLLERSVSTEVGFTRKAVITFTISVRLPTCISVDPKDFREIGYLGLP